MASFQAPFDIMGLRKQNLLEEQMRNAPQQQMFDNIGSSIDSLMGSYVEGQQKKAAGKAYKTAFGVLGPAIGMDEATLKSLTGELKSDADWADFGQTMGPFIPSIANSMLGRNRISASANAPYVAQSIRNQQNIAGGNVPYGGGVPQSPAGMTPVEPDLPVADENLPAVGGAPMAAPNAAIPGGDESMRRYNEWRRQRGY